jgi:hypothetical protein
LYAGDSLGSLVNLAYEEVLAFNVHSLEYFLDPVLVRTERTSKPSYKWSPWEEIGSLA